MQARTVKAIYNMNFKTYPFTGIWQQAFGEPEQNGAWLIWGEEKMGKTWFALTLANYISSFARTLYISAEEGLGKNFQETCRRAGITAESTLRALEYIPIIELEAKLQTRRAPRVILLDNITIYNEELKYGKFLDLIRKHQDKLFIFLAHEEAGKPYTSSAKLCSRYAKILIHVEGLTAFVKGRCPGGYITIDEQKSDIYWGVEKQNQ